jgi:predicted nucleic acid-binding protein
MSKKQPYSVLLDTSFVIRLLSQGDPLHDNALGYYKYFMDNKIEMKISTISIAEYCVKGIISELPLANLKIVPFNVDHAVIAGQYAQTLYRAKNNGNLSIDNRLIIPNDTKLFAQASKDQNVKYFVTSDTKSATAIKTISDDNDVTFCHLDIHTPPNLQFGILF